MRSVILATAGYDHTIRFWEAPSSTCYRTIQMGSGDTVGGEGEEEEVLMGGVSK
jgi:hypothetical protein